MLPLHHADEVSGGIRTRVGGSQSNLRVRVALGTIFCSQAESNCQLEGQSLLCCRYTMRTELPPGFDPGMPDAESDVITPFTT